MKILEAALAEADEAGTKMLPGETAFTLYDTFGFPVDLTADVCRERGIAVDQAGFDAAMDQQRERARAASTFKMAGSARLHAARKTIFDGYDTLAEDGARCRAVSRRQRGRRAERRARRASSCSTARRSMPSRAARSAIAASSRKSGTA